MTAAELQRYLGDHIPLSTALGVRVVELSDEVLCLSAPLAPNVNHHGTAFGGSIAAVALLTGWGWLHARLQGAQSSAGIVVQHHEVDYRAPVRGEFRSVCRGVPADAWDRFEQTLATRRRARLDIDIDIYDGASLAVAARGRYVASA